jgi:hypothetical protein
MQTYIAPIITSTAHLICTEFESPYNLNLAFSASGLSALGVTDDLGNIPFSGGQFADADALVSVLCQNRCETNAALGRPRNGQVGRGVQGHKYQRRLPRR